MEFQIIEENDIQLYKLKTYFEQCTKGYHLINRSPINETVWEEINALILSESGYEVHSKSDGGHVSGMDINSSFGTISNKSAKYSKTKKGTSFDISSYRLTTVCSDKNCGEPTLFIEEINSRKNFEYYSILVRDESDEDENKDKHTIKYDWLYIPSDYQVLDPSAYTWEPTMGKRGKNKDTQVGWHTNELNGCKMSINFSMSSQLWIHVELSEELQEFIIASSTVDCNPKFNYIELYKKNNKK